MSPRIIAVAAFDADDLADAQPASRPAPPAIVVTNVLGFFVDSVSGRHATRTAIVRHPGLYQ